jgi:hypothetical protein
VVLGERDQEVQAFPPQRAQEPLTETIGLGTPHGCFQHPEPQVAHALVELLRRRTAGCHFPASWAWYGDGPTHRIKKDRLCEQGPNLAKGQILANSNPVRPHRRCSPVWS